MKITARVEKFINFLLDGDTQKEAYVKAYPNSVKWKDKTLYNRASELFRDPDVFNLYEKKKKQLEEEHRKKNLWSREKAAIGLGWIMNQAKQDIMSNGLKSANSATFLNALKELNALEGIGAEREVSIEHIKANIEKIKGGNEITVEDKIENLFNKLTEEINND